MKLWICWRCLRVSGISSLDPKTKIITEIPNNPIDQYTLGRQWGLIYNKKIDQILSLCPVCKIIMQSNKE